MSNDKDFKVKNGIQPTVYQEGLGTVATGSVAVGYDLSVAAYDSKSFSVAGQSTAPLSIFFNDAGTKLFLLQSNGSAYQYSLSTAWDISTSSYDSVSFDPTGQMSNPYALEFANSGSKMYIQDYYGPVYEYTLSTAYDLSTASYSSNSYDPTEILSQGYGVIISPDGTKFYTVSASDEAVFQYSLSTAYDISTASYDSKTLSVASQDLTAFDITFNNNGKILFVMGNVNDTVFQYNLSVAYDISTASYSNISFSVASQENNPSAVCFKPDGTKMYVVGFTNDTIYQYSTGATVTTNTLDLSTGSAFQITPTSDIQVGLSNPAASGTVSQATLLLDGAVNGYDLSGAAYDSVSFSISGQDTVPSDIRLNSDGTKVFLVGRSGSDINEYSLSTAYDLSTASHITQFSVSSQETLPLGLSFKTDGTKMYVVGLSNDTVYQYSLSTAYSLASASYDSASFSIATQDGAPWSLAFKPDGTKMFVLGNDNRKIFYYTLSTPWDVSTATYVSSTSALTSQESNPLGMEFNSDGTKVFLVGTQNKRADSYTLSTAYDISTLTYDNISFSVSSEEENPSGITFSNDGTKMYVVGHSSDTIYQYSTGSAYTVTYDSTIQFGGGTAPDSPLANETDVLTFSTRDGGTTYQAAQAIDGAV